MQRVAIEISGTLRQFKSCYPTFKQHILDAIPYKFDIFLSSWNSQIQHFKSYHDNRDEGTFKEAINLFNPIYYDSPVYNEKTRQYLYKESKMDEFQKFVLANRKCDASHKETKGKCRICLSKCIHNEIGMFWQIKNCNRLRNINNFKYDFIIRTRYDNFYMSSLLEEYLSLADDKTLLVPEGFDGVPQYRNGCNDQIAIGTTSVMNVYSTIYDSMGDYAMENALHSQGTGCPHYFINLQMERHGIEIKRIPWRYCLYKKRGVLAKKLKDGIPYKDIRV